MIEPRMGHPLLPVALSGLLLAVAAANGVLEVVLPVVPLLLLVASLLFGLYPGCDAAVRLAERIGSRSRAEAAAVRNSRTPVPPARRAAHGGLLLALGLSGRAPPA